MLTGQNIDYRKWNTDPRTMSAMPSGEYKGMIPVILPLTYKISTTPVTYHTSSGTLVVNPNFRVHPSTAVQSEVPLTRHPTNPQILFASSNAAEMMGTYLAFISEGMYVSTNGGTSWFGSDTTEAAPVSNHGGDPAPAVGPNGYFYQSYLGYYATGIYTSYSTNYGSTWANTTTIVTGSQDKNHTFVNDVPSSPYYGRVFVTWSLFTAPLPNCVVSYSSNSGVTYSGVINVGTSPAGHYQQGVNGGIMPNGDAVICWQTPITTMPYTGDYIGFAKSTNGGVTWNANNNVYNCNGIRGNLFAANIRVNDFPWMGIDRTGGSRNGWIYIVTAEKNLSPAGTDADIVMHKSTDGGTTWSAGVRVNQDALNNGKVQYMHSCRVDETGGIDVIYYDNRNVTGDSVQVYISRSVDGGTTFSDVRVSDHNFKPGSIAGLAGGYQGDYIGITSGNGKLYAYWADNSTGIYQAWMSIIDISPSITHTPLNNTEQTSGNRLVNCNILPAGSGINPGLTKLYYAKNGTIWSNINMTNSGTTWFANLPLSGAGIYNYYITTTDSLSRTVTSPENAPVIYNTFAADVDTIKPHIIHTPLPNIPKQIWPASVTASAYDNIGVDSVWVRWYKGSSPSNVKQFKLNFASGTNYSSLFNSLNADVNIGDSVFYRIIAQDVSSNHNKDSTELNKFAISNVFSNYICRNSYIPIRDTVTTYDSFQVGTHLSILKVNFAMVDLVHSYVSDVLFALRSPSGTEVILSAYNSGGLFGANYTNTIFNDSATVPISSGLAPFTGTFKPDSALSAFSNQDAYGWWRFRVYDNAIGDTGHISQYCVQIFTAGTITGNINNGNVPSLYSLSQNYPNPFNPVTKINFSLPKQDFVTLKIYDILGREIKTLVNEYRIAGYHSVEFDGSGFASGVYFAKLEAGNYRNIIKMMMIK